MDEADGRCKRSQSADIPYHAGGDNSVSGSECDLQNEILIRKSPDRTRQKNKLAGRFPLFGNDAGDCDTQINNEDESQVIYNDITGLFFIYCSHFFSLK